ncbi:MAG TPA: FecR domain-containing protein [Chryseolinea sp.]|nr:FecR domain-containing protein [Chryseolinea sp.]
MEIEVLIYKALTGKASPAEMTRLAHWIASDPRHADDYNEMKLFYEPKSDPSEAMEFDEERQAAHKDRQAELRKYLRRRKRNVQYIALCAGIVMATAIVFVSSDGETGRWKVPVHDVSSTSLKQTLAFKETTLADIIIHIEREYGLNINAKNRDLLSCRFTGTFSRGLPVEQALRTLALSHALSLKVINDRGFELDGKGCAPVVTMLRRSNAQHAGAGIH